MIFSEVLPFYKMKEPVFLDPVVSGHLSSCFGYVESGLQKFPLVQSSDLEEQAKL